MLITRPDFGGVVSGALPYEREMVEDVVLYFDHHLSGAERVGERDNLVIDPEPPSAARVIYNHFGGRRGFPMFPTDLVKALDQADLADYVRRRYSSAD